MHWRWPPAIEHSNRVTQRLAKAVFTVAIIVLGVASGTAAASAAPAHHKAVQITGGESHTCAVTSDGEALCWGSNGYGQLGDGTNSARRLAPHQVFGLGTGVLQLAAGDFHTCALIAGGSVKCWGSNYDGEVGDGTSQLRRKPHQVVGLTRGVVAIAAGGGASCALMRSGRVKCWGRTAGNGTQTGSPTPVQVHGVTSGATAISVGEDLGCVIAIAGDLTCWGLNGYGEIGDGTDDAHWIPDQVTGLTSGVAEASAGNDHTCAIVSGGSVKCWGENYHGQLGDGTVHDRLTPHQVSGLTKRVQKLATGAGLISCAITHSGAAKCWGDNDHGQIGDGTLQSRKVPQQVTGLTSGIVGIATSFGHTCSVDVNGHVKCWGTDGRLGDGTHNVHLTPHLVLGF